MVVKFMYHISNLCLFSIYLFELLETIYKQKKLKKSKKQYISRVLENLMYERRNERELYDTTIRIRSKELIADWWNGYVSTVDYKGYSK